MVQFNLKGKKVCFFSLLSLIATLYNCNALNNTSFFNNSFSLVGNVFFAIFFFVLYYCFYKSTLRMVREISLLSVIIGVFAGIINVLGRNFVLHNGMQFFSENICFAVVFSLLAAAGHGLIYANIFEVGWGYLESQATREIEGKNDSSFTNKISFTIFDKHPFLYPFLLIILFWLPFLVSFFPGMLQWDAVSALLGYYGIDNWTNHHPIVSTLLMGYIMDLGKYLGDDNLGCAFYVLLQYWLLSLTLAYNFVFFAKWRTPYLIRWLVLIIFLIHPVFPTFAMTEVKDIFYYVACQWLLFMFIRCYDNYSKNLLVYIGVASMFVSALRKEGIIVCLLCSLVLLLFQGAIYEKWKNILNAMILGIFLATFLSHAALAYYSVGRSSIAEALSIPVQQTARYIRDHSEDITESEWETLNTVFRNPANNLGRFYFPDSSDPVKAQIVYGLSKKQMAAYFKVWAIHFLRHPGCYFSAAFNQMYGYFYIGKEAMYKIGDCRTANFVKGDAFYCECFNIVDNPRTISFRKTMTKYIYYWPDLPLLGMLYHPAVYTWILFFGLSCALRLKQYKYLFLYCMPLTVLCVCCLSPVNAFIRYSYPILMSCFILAIYNLRLVSCKILREG